MGSFSHSSCAGKVRGIQAFHKNSRGWADIAYNAVVCPHGYVFEGRGPGVTSAANGNTQTNGDWYAVCYLGGEGDGFTSEGKAGFVEAVQWLRSDGKAGPRVNGHRDHKATACPGDEIYAWLKTANFDKKGEPVTPEPKPTKVAQADDLLKAAARKVARAEKDVRDAVALLEQTDPLRVVVHRRIADVAALEDLLHDVKRQIRGVELPDA
jgi:hypothetical protein